MNNETLDQIHQISTLFAFDKVFALIVAISLLVLTVRTVNYFADKLEVLFPSKRLLISQVITIFTFLTYIFGVNFLFFAIIRPPKELILAMGGSIAVALGLSLKDLVASIVAGLILLFDRPFQVGDRVSFEGQYGEIQSIGLRAVRLITLDDNQVTIPNNRFITDLVSSGNAGALDMMVVVHFHLALDTDIELARKLLRDIIVTSNYVFLKKPVQLVLSEEIHSGQVIVKLTAKCYVLDIHYEKALESDIYLRTNRSFKKHGIARPKWNVMNS